MNNEPIKEIVEIYVGVNQPLVVRTRAVEEKPKSFTFLESTRMARLTLRKAQLFEHKRYIGLNVMYCLNKPEEIKKALNFMQEKLTEEYEKLAQEAGASKAMLENFNESIKQYK